MFFYKVTILKLNNFGCDRWILMISVSKCSFDISILYLSPFWNFGPLITGLAPVAQNVHFTPIFRKIYTQTMIFRDCIVFSATQWGLPWLQKLLLCLLIIHSKWKKFFIWWNQHFNTRSELDPRKLTNQSSFRAFKPTHISLLKKVAKQLNYRLKTVKKHIKDSGYTSDTYTHCPSPETGW